MAIRIGMVGTFDVANFGDLLFPLIALHELSRRLGPVEIVPYSYHARSASSWPFAVTSLERLPHEVASLNLLLVGGGDIIRFDPLVALDYRPDSPNIHHPTGFWLAPILFACTAGVPVAWNAPGLPDSEIPLWVRALVRASVASCAYVSVRDVASRDLIAGVAGDVRVDVVPDSGFSAAMLLPNIHDASDYFVVQSRPQALEWLPRVRELLGDDRSRFILAPVGPVTGDRTRPPERLPPQTMFSHPRHPCEMLELIAGSRGVVGPSLHLSIAAISFGRPAFRPMTPPLRKYQMFEGLQGVHQFEGPLREPGHTLPLMPEASQLAEIHRRLGCHWDSIAALVSKTAARSSRAKWEPLLMDLWQSLPSRLERRSAVARLRTTLQTARTRVARYRHGGQDE